MNHALKFNDGTGAAMVNDHGTYSVYKLKGAEYFSQHFDGKIIHPLGSDTQIAGADSNVKALITRDNYVVDLRGSAAKINYAGATGDPLKPYAEISKIAGKDEFIQRFELANRAVGFNALDYAEWAAKSAHQGIKEDVNTGKAEFMPEAQVQFKNTLDAMVPKDREILSLTKEADGLHSLYDPDSPGYRFADLPVSSKVQGYMEREYKLRQQIAKLTTERQQISQQGYPLLGYLDPKQTVELRGKTPEQQATTIKDTIAGVQKGVDTTRSNIVSGDLNLLTVDKIREATIERLGLQGQKRNWVNDAAKHAENVETAKTIGMGVLSFGLTFMAPYTAAPRLMGAAGGIVGLADGYNNVQSLL